MGKSLDRVTDEDLARAGLADFSINPRPITPWRTEQHRLTGVPPTDEEWSAILEACDDAHPTRSDRPDFPAHCVWHDGLSTNGDIYVMSEKETGEIALWIWAAGMPAWAVLERSKYIVLARKRLKEIRAAIERGETTIAELAENIVERSRHPQFGRF